MQVADVYCDKSPRPAYYPVNDGGRSDGWRPLSKYLPQRRAPSKIDDDGSNEPSAGKDEPPPGEVVAVNNCLAVDMGCA
jgi:hypothetical protein